MEASNRFNISESEGHKLPPGPDLGPRRGPDGRLRHLVQGHPALGIERDLVHPAARDEKLGKIGPVQDGGVAIDGFPRRLENTPDLIKFIAQGTVRRA